MERARPAITIGLAVAAAVLVVFVATSGHVPLATEGTGGWHLDRRPARSDDRPTEEVVPFDDRPSTSRLPGEEAIGVLAQTAVIVVGGVALYLVGRRIARLGRRPVDPLDLPPEEHWPEPTAEMSDAVDHGLATLAAGPVDEVVVACWVRLEEAAEAAGVGRRPAETSAELAARVLDDLHAPASAVAALLERYRQARFSHHRLGEDDRATAIASLEEIRLAIAGVRA